MAYDYMNLERGCEKMSEMKRALMLLAVIALLALPLAALAGDGDPDVCPAHDSGKINTDGDPATVTVTALEGKLISGYCVKAGAQASGAGTVFVEVDPAQKTVVIDHPEVDSVSHYSLVYVDVPTTTTPSTSPSTTQPEVTTTISNSTTTQPEVTTTVSAESTTSVAGGGSTTSVADSSTTTEETLPFTGSDVGLLASIAGVLLLGGATVLWAVRGDEA